ncbi:hypothetical protein AAVH_24771 [Aphelenchoides avenae]|nr:hypothetical protein AAVH_24771 [Aphelenchus avenae]
MQRLKIESCHLRSSHVDDYFLHACRARGITEIDVVDASQTESLISPNGIVEFLESNKTALRDSSRDKRRIEVCFSGNSMAAVQRIILACEQGRLAERFFAYLGHNYGKALLAEMMEWYSDFHTMYIVMNGTTLAYFKVPALSIEILVSKNGVTVARPKAMKLSDDGFAEAFSCLNRWSLESSQLACRRFRRLVDVHLNSICFRFVREIRLTFVGDESPVLSSEWEMSYPDDCSRPEGVTLTRAVARVYNPKLFSHICCGCFHIYRTSYSGSLFTTKEFHAEVVSIAAKVRFVEQLRFDSTAFPEPGGMLGILKTFTEENMLEINWKLGVHDLRSYTPLRVGVDDDVLRTCVEKKVACVYDSSGVTTNVSEDSLMNFCFSGSEVLRKAPNVTHARLMHRRRCLFVHLKPLSPDFVKLFVESALLGYASSVPIPEFKDNSNSKNDAKSTQLGFYAL